MLYVDRPTVGCSVDRAANGLADHTMAAASRIVGKGLAVGFIAQGQKGRPVAQRNEDSGGGQALRPTAEGPVFKGKKTTSKDSSSLARCRSSAAHVSGGFVSGGVVCFAANGPGSVRPNAGLF